MYKLTALEGRVRKIVSNTDKVIRVGDPEWEEYENWLATGGKPEAILTASEKAEIQAKAYIGKRRMAYPSIPDQLDMRFHSLQRKSELPYRHPL